MFIRIFDNSLDSDKNRYNLKAYCYELLRVNQKENTLQAIKIELDNRYKFCKIKRRFKP